MLHLALLLLVAYEARGQVEVCCESSGQCFNDDLPFDGINWPLPECHQPTFHLYRKDITGSVEITRGNTPPEFNPSDDTVYLVHGWTSNGNGWPEDVKDEFLLNENTYNVIVVDWEDGASPVYYPQAASNVRVLGVEIADINQQLSPDYAWCVGHSLGGHGCGHTGKAGGNLDRITGMDPAGPNWDLPECNEDAVTCKLQPSDASQVDVIHTDGTAAGTLQLLGHVDFFPNEGVGIQPGCDTFGCGHSLVYSFFRVSINNDCFVSTHHECSDVRDLPNSCTPCGAANCPNMGASTSFGSGVYYLETDPNDPYCQG